MFHRREFNNKTNFFYEITLRITYSEKSYLLQDLLKRILSSFAIHHKNMQALATKMFKVKNNIAPKIMKEVFAPKMSPYELYNNNVFKRRRINSLWHGTELVSYLGPQMHPMK